MSDETMELESVNQEDTSSESTSMEEEQSSREAAHAAMEEHMKENASPSEGSRMDYNDTFRRLSEGDVVNGVVVHIDREGVLVDVGTKSEGIIRLNELTTRPVASPEEVVSVGDRIDVYVMQTESSEGNLLLSKKRADFEKTWERVQDALQEGKVVTAMVTDRVKGGLVVDLGIRGFVPASHVGGGNVKNLDKYVGQSLPLKILEVDRERRKVVLSHRLAAEEDRTRQRTETVANLKEGEVRPGVVRRITDYGAFVDLGGIDGLLHISEMSWTRINHPSEVVKVGQKLNVMVLKLNLDADRVSLGLRQILPDPWQEIVSHYAVGEIVSGKVTRLVPFGAFVQLNEGIEAIIPNAELSQRRVKRPEEAVSVGDTVQAKIIDIRPEERRMTLSTRQIQQEREEKEERREYDSFRSSKHEQSSRMTLGDLVGDKLQGYGFTSQPEPEEAQVEEVEIVRDEITVVAEVLPEAEAEALVEAAPSEVETPAEVEAAAEPVAEAEAEPNAEVAEEPQQTAEEAPAVVEEAKIEATTTPVE
jgi:4-hydroxy-3-methylbut-2-enyl diphosphate reductase